MVSRGRRSSAATTSRPSPQLPWASRSARCSTVKNRPSATRSAQRSRSTESPVRPTPISVRLYRHPPTTSLLRGSGLRVAILGSNQCPPPCRGGGHFVSCALADRPESPVWPAISCTGSCLVCLTPWPERTDYVQAAGSALVVARARCFVARRLPLALDGSREAGAQLGRELVPAQRQRQALGHRSPRSKWLGLAATRIRIAAA